MKTLLAVLCISAALTTVAPAQVVFSEIQYHPVEEPVFNADGTPFLQLTNDLHEFVEIQNAGAATMNVGGWRLEGGVNYTFPTNTTIAPGTFCVIAKDPVRLAAVYGLNAANVLGPYSGFLGNASESVRLLDSSGGVMDAVTYDSVFPWPASADALGDQDRFTGLNSTNYQYKGRSLQRVSLAWPSSDPANWLASPLSGPTPGSAQAVTRTVPKPVVVAKSAAQTSDGALIVRSNQAVTIQCTYSATNNLSNVTLEYFLQNVNLTNQATTTVAMTDLGGGKYSAAIPGQTNRAIVRYRFRANRGDGLEVVSPRADDPQIIPSGAGGALEAWWGYFVTPIRTTTNAATYDVFVSTGNLSRMASNVAQNPKRVTAAAAAGLPRDVPYVAATAAQWNGTVYGVFACDGVVYDIHIRYHGSRYHRAASNHSYKLHFPSHLPFNGQSSWFETLHGTEFIEAQKINRLLGLPASRMRRVDWYLNNSATNEVHSEQGEFAGEMLDEWHALQQQLNPGSAKEGNGELYKNVGNRDASQNNLEGPYTRGDIAPMLANTSWTQLQRYEWTFSLQNNSWKGSKQLRDLLDGMWTARGDSPSAANFTNTPAKLAAARLWFTNNWDIDANLTSLAMLEWMSIWDDAAQNHFFWRREIGKWTRLGWDYDGVMSTGSTGGGGGALGGTTNQTIYGGENGAPTVFDGVNWWKDTFYKCFKPEYQRRIWELNNSFFEPANLLANGLTTAARFATNRRAYVNTQLSALGTYYKPARPVNLSPANLAVIAGATSLVTSAYSHPLSTPHYGTIWEVRTASGTYEAPVLRETSTNNKTAYPIPYDQLTYGATYYWRATHLDSNLHPSIVSAETRFTWGAASVTAGALVLNEILAWNRKTLEHGGAFPDYIELRNNTTTNIPLAGFSLTDDPLNPTKFSLPADAMLAPEGHLVIYADTDTNSSGLHTGFAINGEGETVLLMQGTTIVDSVTFGPQAPDVSIGRIVNGTGGWQANTPTPGTANSAKVLGTATNLRVNEWMADPAYGEDWFELFNSDTNVVALSGLWLSDTPSTPFITQLPALSFIEPKGTTRLWADGSAGGGPHCNFKLSKSGESIVLTAVNGGSTIDTITFSGQTTDVSQGRLPDGSATVVSFSSKSASPGSGNWAPAPVVINEVLSRHNAPFEDAVELFNATAAAVDLSGWWLSDDVSVRQKFRIPTGTVLPSGGYRVFYSADFAAGAVPFALSAAGDEVVLSAVDAVGNLTGYGSQVRFGAASQNVSFGRVTATGLGPASGGAEFWPTTAHTFGQDNPANVSEFRSGAGAANTSPLIGPVTINEVMYHPVDVGTNDNTRDEFIELANVSNTNVDLSLWKLRGDSELSFPLGTVLPAGGYLLLVSFDPLQATNLAAFRTVYGLTSSVPILGPYSGRLQNNTHSVELGYPATLNGATHYVNVDKVEYRDLSPWPTAADGTGYSLQRSSSRVIGNTAANWTGNPPTPGAVNLGLNAALEIVTASPLPGAVVGLGYSNQLMAAGGTPPYSWAITSGTVAGLTLATNGLMTGTPASAGTNTLIVRLSDSAGATTANSFRLVVAGYALAISTAATLPDAALYQPYSGTLTATGGTTPYVWALVGGALPGGLSLNGAGVISGLPTNHGTFNFTAQVSDSGGLVATQSFTLAVPVQPLVITTLTPLVSGQEGSNYSQALTASGGIPPYSWGLASGTLPPGLQLSEAGDLTGKPNTPGTYSFTVRATDHAATTTTKALSLTINSATLTITTAWLPDSIVGASYSQPLTASGGTAPYAWSLASGQIPPGLTLLDNGVVQGTPTNGGTFSFTVRVTDAGSATATKLFTVGIQNNLPCITANVQDGNAFHLLVDGDPGATYMIEATTNFLDWQTVFTTNGPALPFVWSDSSVNSPAPRFYRIALQP